MTAGTPRLREEETAFDLFEQGLGSKLSDDRLNSSDEESVQTVIYGLEAR